ncbi:MAG TPA: alanine--tRNA ligase, partial [Thermoanaerobaculia bacterium]|nr:alanine--tRNA ligase [Thermoanaerobaculia bacterium]
FTGLETRAVPRAASSQKCVRAGGKHNDLDNVGYTARHHTFFEMLGNFSFGDYFKEEAIAFAWELVTERYGFDPKRLWATVYTDDDEAANLWQQYLPAGRILRFGEKDNFWSMGDTGPCGPCSELHVDQGPHVPGDETPNGRGDRIMEIWNLVFMQFDRDAEGRMTPLPKPSVDTGAGLERITALLTGKNNNFDTDLFTPLIHKIEAISGKTYRGGMVAEDAPFRVIADHLRAATMLMTDGVMPANTGRGYVLRRILRRAARYGRRLGIDGPELCGLVEPVFDVFEGIYFGDPHRTLKSEVRELVRSEERSFARTMSAGADRVGEAISEARRKEETSLSGAAVFRFYDTYGIPLELIEELAQDEGLTVDRAGFEKELEVARERSKGASKFEADDALLPEELADPSWETVFSGYPEDDFVRLEGARALGLFSLSGGPAPVEELPAGTEGLLVTDRTVFYPEGGGQVTDTGSVAWPGGRATVSSARKSASGRLIQHHVKVEEGTLQRAAALTLEVSEWTRRRTQANHTGTHLLHAALRKVLGDSVRQMGSLVAPDRLRFDYAATRATTAAEILDVERLVNEAILRDAPVSKEVTSMDEARAKGAMMFFGEKYGERVRVVDVPGVSTELCGGCHVGRTGEIGAFKVTSDRGLAAGVRRIEAITALGAVERLTRDEQILGELSEATQVPPEDLPGKLRELLARLRDAEKEIAKLKVQLASGSQAGAGASEADGLVDVAGVKVLARRVPSLPVNELRNLADTFRGKLKSGIVLLGTETEGRVTLLAAVTADLVSRVSADDLARAMAPVVGGKGGGKADLAQAGGKDPEKIEAALEAGLARVREKVGGAA